MSVTSLAPGASLNVTGTFTPTAAGLVGSTLLVDSNDPSGGPLEVPITAMGVQPGQPPPSGRLAVSIEPASIGYGVSVRVTVWTKDSASHLPVPGKVRITNFDAQGKSLQVELDTNTSFPMTFHAGREWDPERRLWMPGMPPSGTVNAITGYELDRGTPVPFNFP